MRIRKRSKLDEWVFSEESWTKSKNWARRLLLLAVFAALIATAAAGGASFLYARLAWSDLERHYLRSYLWAAFPSVLSSTGTYNLVVVGAPPGPDYFATSADVVLRNGKFGLTSAAESRGAMGAWERQYTNVPHAEAYWTFREYVYGGRSCGQLFRIPRWIGLVLFVVFVWRGALRDHEDRQFKQTGLIEQGPGLVTPEEFNQVYQGDGIGLHVKNPSGRSTIQIRIPKAYEPQSAVVLGDTGAGKTVALMQLIDQIEARGDLAVIHDPKASYLPTYFSSKRGDIVLNPFDVRSPFWNPADEVSSEHDIETVATAFFPDVPGKDVFWTESPRKLMTVLLAKGLSAAEMVRLF
jgi:Type IV secretion-system coupling protein DNA-binding domain